MRDLISEFIVVTTSGTRQRLQATKLHFEDLAKRYGNPIIVLNLIKVIPHIKIVSALTNMNLHVFFIPFPFFLCINELLLL